MEVLVPVNMPLLVEVDSLDRLSRRSTPTDRIRLRRLKGMLMSARPQLDRTSAPNMKRSFDETSAWFRSTAAKTLRFD